MLDEDLAEAEAEALRSQFVISNEGRGGRQIFEALRQLIMPPPRAKRPVGFRVREGEE